MRSRKGYLQVVGKSIPIHVSEWINWIIPPNFNPQTINIHSVPPIIVETSTTNDMVVREGSNVSLLCKARGYPEPYVSALSCSSTIRCFSCCDKCKFTLFVSIYQVMWRREDGDEMTISGQSGMKFYLFLFPTNIMHFNGILNIHPTYQCQSNRNPIFHFEISIVK